MKDFQFELKLIINLSLFGVILGIFNVMAFAVNFEWILWLVGWTVTSLVVSKKLKERYFIHAFATGFLMAILSDLIRVIMYDTYIESHPDFINRFESYNINNARLFILSFGVITSVFSGLIAGVLTLGFKKFQRNN